MCLTNDDAKIDKQQITRFLDDVRWTKNRAEQEIRDRQGKEDPDLEEWAEVFAYARALLGTVKGTEAVPAFAVTWIRELSYFRQNLIVGMAGKEVTCLSGILTKLDELYREAPVA